MGSKSRHPLTTLSTSANAPTSSSSIVRPSANWICEWDMHSLCWASSEVPDYLNNIKVFAAPVNIARMCMHLSYRCVVSDACTPTTAETSNASFSQAATTRVECSGVESHQQQADHKMMSSSDAGAAAHLVSIGCSDIGGLAQVSQVLQMPYFVSGPRRLCAPGSAPAPGQTPGWV